jgi:hypothetical protein
MSSYLEDPEHRDLNFPELRRFQLSPARAHRVETQYCRPDQRGEYRELEPLAIMYNAKAAIVQSSSNHHYPRHQAYCDFATRLTCLTLCARASSRGQRY